MDEEQIKEEFKKAFPNAANLIANKHQILTTRDQHIYWEAESKLIGFEKGIEVGERI